MAKAYLLEKKKQQQQKKTHTHFKHQDLLVEELFLTSFTLGRFSVDFSTSTS